MDQLVCDDSEATLSFDDGSSSAALGTSVPPETTDEWIPLHALKAGADDFAGIVVKSARMRELVDRITLVAPYKGTVLIQGESGTGKELTAAALHRFGPAPQGPLVILNCSNLLGSLAEAQLFGHVRGAFTDAREDSLGYFRSANGGTLVLDEVGELPLTLQPKLLRAVETHEVQPVGSTKSHKVDVRLVAATNRDLAAMVKSGDFRADLYYRLNAISLRIPALRERRDGIGALAAHFIEQSEHICGKRIRFLSKLALEWLVSLEWQGNVREFANAIQSAVMLTTKDCLCIADFAHMGSEEQNSGAAGREDGRLESATAKLHPSESRSLRQASESATKALLLETLNETGGNCSRTARALGVSRFTVYRLIGRYGLVRHRGRKRSKDYFTEGE